MTPESMDIVCSKCNASFSSREEYLAHRQYPCGTGVVSAPLPSRLHCPECWKRGKTFVGKKESGLAHHRSMAHGVASPSMTNVNRAKWFKEQVRKGVITEADVLAQGYDLETGKKLGAAPEQPKKVFMKTELTPRPVPDIVAVTELPKPMVRVIIKFCPKCKTLWDSLTDMKFCQDCGGELQAPLRRKSVTVEGNGT